MRERDADLGPQSSESRPVHQRRLRLFAFRDVVVHADQAGDVHLNRDRAANLAVNKLSHGQSRTKIK